MAHEIPVTQARAELADLINRVVYGNERVVLTRHGKPLVALVSAADLERLEAAAPEEEQVISTVSSVRQLGSGSGERQRFGIAAHHPDPPAAPRSTGAAAQHDGPAAGDRRPGRKG